MKKVVLSFLLIGTCALSSHAQLKVFQNGNTAANDCMPFAEERKAWVTRDTSDGDVLTSFYVEGDTVIDGKPCLKVWGQQLLPQGRGKTYKGAFYEAAGKVWLCEAGNKEAVLLYDFNACPGDQVTVNSRQSYTIARVDSVESGGQLFKRLFVNDSEGRQTDVWVEGIGGQRLFCTGRPGDSHVISCLRNTGEMFTGDCFTAVAPAAYHPMLTDGKRWNQSYTDNLHPQDNYLFSFELRGDTIVGGVRMHRLYSHNLNRSGKERYLGLLFETGRCVYALPTAAEFSNVRLLYDFNLEVGDRTDVNYMLPVYEKTLDHVPGAGTSLRRQGMGYGNGHDVNTGAIAWWVEGIGSSACFFPSYSWTPGMHVSLDDCTLDGEVLFTHDDFLIPKDEEQETKKAPYHPMFKEGKQWLYHYVYRQMGDDGLSVAAVTEYDVAYVVRGDTLIDGRHYHKLYREYEGNSEYDSAWREEGTSVYVVWQGRQETLFYDFGLPRWGLAPYAYGTASSDERVYLSSTEVIRVEGVYFNRYWFVNDFFSPGTYWIDGVGSQNGLVSPYLMYAYYNYPNLIFRSCTEPDGFCFKKEDGWCEAVDYQEEPSVINTIDTETAYRRVYSSSLYDLYGRRIEGTPSRGIYIRDGRKYVVK